jgi:hypothetical protein
VISSYTGDSLYVVGLPDGPLVVDLGFEPEKKKYFRVPPRPK